MELPESATALVESIHDGAGVERVYGEPIDRDGRTVVPVARVAYGFGGGFGTDSNAAEESPAEDPPGSSGGGGGGGVASKPIGALEITDENTRFVRFDDRKQVVAALALGIVVGWLLGRLRE